MDVSVISWMAQNMGGLITGGSSFLILLITWFLIRENLSKTKDLSDKIDKMGTDFFNKTKELKDDFILKTNKFVEFDICNLKHQKFEILMGEIRSNFEEFKRFTNDKFDKIDNKLDKIIDRLQSNV